MTAFFSPAGEAITAEEFISVYSDEYYLDGPCIVSGVSRNSRHVEDEIDSILKNGIEEKKDVARILAWKMGKIRQAESREGFVYADDWADAEKLVVTRYGRSFDLEKIASFIFDNIERLEERSKSDPQAVLNELRSQRVKGLGTVYLMTLLTFISRGEWPIYDLFASMALEAIRNGAEPGSWIRCYQLPGIDAKSRFEHAVENHLKPYAGALEGVFPGKWQESRDVDRALWVYGHRFRQA